VYQNYIDVKLLNFFKIKSIKIVSLLEQLSDRK